MVDDDQSSCFLVASLVPRLFPGAVASSASDGDKALALYRERGADLLFSDCSMPIMDGITLTAALRAEGATLPIVLTSGEQAYQALGEAAGANAFILKPYGVEDIVRVFQAWLPT